MGALEQIKKWRRQLHQIPEIGLQEYQTSNYLKKELIEMGYDPISILDTGILVYIDHHQDKTVAFRSDMDGLNQLITPSDQSIQIRIGSEIGHDLFQNMSLIQATYQVDGHGQGIIALLGPSNMQYSKMFGLLDAFRQELSEKLGEYYRSLDQCR